MRLDKFLKLSRLIKRRTVAKEACDKGMVSVNGKVAKAGDILKVGDIIEIDFGTRVIKAEVLDLKEHALKEDAEKMYRLI
ncbi:RNA-binding S4 domain-containing protein [Thermoanaerobacterium thermosaccharolyticum]|uniref:RQC P-site tRNA stabilizing factor n=3 Tax=Thermoanaerobacterium thermosaccharolyticum TaxID=1517 RepID=D9TQ49_THETC|nr:RNA-binding S4 domain-containing protein [Thermoanaerobacterium thermosaccharolyticum]TCW42597.1 ribosomal 50S subunit-recycling heat shock protein [Thermohydrogenium kirishiense]ADL67836.1 RNA-binding S4 domain protein [Thermoanaerobacterium thermosaccharolyticum DSM 571]AGB17990.1 ribosome-associated heat shock protein implicated in recycling of 50S subunit [Thermoanaerobacterium thermosaccharolyticum M0795]AST57689.1 RNA-binding protein [Thermoanaerobacterium thermosaccharolyticum]KAA580